MYKPNVITLIGSTKFKDEFIKLNRLFTSQGCVVIHTPYFSHAEGEELSPELVKTLYDVGKKRISISSSVVVINKNGYIGESTRCELLYAKAIGVPVTYAYQNQATLNIAVNTSPNDNGDPYTKIYSGRQQGSTTMLIILAAMNNAYVVTQNMQQGRYFIDFAKEIGEEIPGIIVVDTKKEKFLTISSNRAESGSCDLDTLFGYGPVYIDDANVYPQVTELVKSYTPNVIGEVFKMEPLDMREI